MFSRCLPSSGKDSGPSPPLLPFTVTRPVTSEEISIALDTLDTRVAVGRELTKSNSLTDSALQKRNLADYSV